MRKNIVHVIGTGTIGEPLIGLLLNFHASFGIDEITCHERSPLLNDRSKILALDRRGASLCVDKKLREIQLWRDVPTPDDSRGG